MKREPFRDPDLPDHLNALFAELEMELGRDQLEPANENKRMKEFIKITEEQNSPTAILRAREAYLRLSASSSKGAANADK